MEIIGPRSGIRALERSGRALSLSFGGAALGGRELLGRCERSIEAFGALDLGAHDAPESGCRCGVPAHYEAGRRSGSGVLAAIRLDGRIVLEPEGMRGARGVLLALAPARGTTVGARLGLQEAASRLGLPVVERDELTAVAEAAAPLVAPAERPAVDERTADVPLRTVPVAPLFRFRFGPERGELLPIGFGGDRLGDELPIGWSGAIGDVIALDADTALASFERVPDELRPTAEAVLQLWAEDDGWRLSILPGTRALGALADLGEHTGMTCQDCRLLLNTGYASGMALQARGYMRTRCPRCGGRMAWYERPELRSRPVSSGSGDERDG